MNQLAWRAAATIVAIVCSTSFALAQPQVPSRYAVEEYIRIEGACNPAAIAFAPAGSKFFGGQMFVCFANDASGGAARTIWRVPEKGKSVLFTRPPDYHHAMVIPPPGSPFGERLYAALEPRFGSYDASGKWTQLADTRRDQLYGLRLGPGGRWGRDFYILDNCQSSGRLQRCGPDGTLTTIAANLPPHAMGMDFSPGGAWGDYLYLGLSGSGIYRVDPNGGVSLFVAGKDMPENQGWQAGHAFDTGGDFGGNLFYTSLALSTITQVDANGSLTEFASGFNFGAGNQATGQIAFGPDRAMYVCDGQNNVVWRISRNRLGLLREAGDDTVVTAGGETHRGTLANDKFVLEAALGKLTLKAGQVVGMAAAGGGAVLCLLSDGQIVRGKLAGEAVRITLSGGEKKTVSVTAFRQWSRRVSSDYPAAVGPAGPLLVLRDGQELLVDANDATLDLRARWGAVRLNWADVVDVSAVASAGGSAEAVVGKPSALLRVRLVSGSVLTGVFEGGKVSLAAKLGGRVEAPATEVVQLRTGRPEQPSPWWTRVELAGGDVLIGSPGQGAIRVRTQAGAAEVPVRDIREVAAVPTIPGGIRLRLWDGNVIGGLAEKGDFRFTMRTGSEVAVPADQVVQFMCPIRGSAEEYAKRLSQLVERLGAERYQDREAATKELIEMGPAIAPFLDAFRQHADPEVRERVRLILERVGVGKTFGMTSATSVPLDGGLESAPVKDEVMRIVSDTGTILILIKPRIIIHQEEGERAFPPDPQGLCDPC